MTTIDNIPYLKLLAQQYPTIQTASTEIIKLNANLQLPKGTEHFISDIHGEYEPFLHILKNGSGSIRRKIDELFINELSLREKSTLATLIYYPEKKLSRILQKIDSPDEWLRITLFRLIRLCRVVASKYTRSAVWQAIPDEFGDVILEMLHEQEGLDNKQEYYQSIIDSIIDIGQGRAFIIALAYLIQRLSIACLHIIGDVYDRGPGAHIVMDTLLKYPVVDIQWGNHDIVWMGAAAGSDACMANVIRISLRYANMETLADGYAISLLPLASFAMETYADDPCDIFRAKLSGEEEFTENELLLMARMHKAIAIIQMKVEAQVIMRRPHYQMENRLMLGKIDQQTGIITIGEQQYPLLDTHFPTIDPADPYTLTPQELALVRRLRLSFANSEKLQRHVRFLFSKGSMYLVHNGNLLYHGCITMNEDGSFMALNKDGQSYAAKAYMDRVERLARQGYFSENQALKQYGMDTMWYLWSGSRSPLFGKDKMATFERYFIADKETHQEQKNPYYALRDREETARRILAEFGLDPDCAHIINGHVPVKVKKGESPVKANGRLLVIDGGLSKAYQNQTGIAGYTLISNSYGLLLASHEPFVSTSQAIDSEYDMGTQTKILETNTSRLRIKDTDHGRLIRQRIDELKALLDAYRTGLIKEIGY